MLLMSFADALRAARDKTGLTQEEVADKVDLTRSHYSNVEIGKKKPPLKNVSQLADALDLKGEERADFIELAYMEHVPDRIRIRIERMERQLDGLRAFALKIASKAGIKVPEELL